MPQYLVTMDIHGADPLLPIDRLAGVIREAVLPSVERLVELKARRKVVTGGYPVGQRAIVFIIEMDSEEELHKILRELPPSEGAKARVTPLKSFEAPRGERHLDLRLPAYRGGEADLRCVVSLYSAAGIGTAYGLDLRERSPSTR